MDMLLLSNAELIEAAKRGSRRSAAIVHLEMKRGLNSLATIASIAPFLGVFGNIERIVTSFGGCGCSKETLMAATFEGPSQSFVPTALGLLVALPALWCFQYFSSDLEAFEVEMENASELTELPG
jgi:biopolymer transport protein ExbB/biopolymer transport protein TolQ